MSHKLLITYQQGLLAQLVERGADNAKVVSSILTQTTKKVFFLLIFLFKIF